MIAGYIDRPGLGLELAKLEKDGKLFTSSGLYVLFCHITDLKLLDNINANCIDVLGKLHPLKYVPVHKAAYDHTYMIETFGHNQPNPILHYDNNPVPMTEDGKIDMPYLKALVALQPQKYGISGRKTDMSYHCRCLKLSFRIREESQLASLGLDNDNHDVNTCNCIAMAYEKSPFSLSTKVKGIKACTRFGNVAFVNNYWDCLTSCNACGVSSIQLQAPIPTTNGVQQFTRSSRRGNN